MKRVFLTTLLVTTLLVARSSVASAFAPITGMICSVHRRGTASLRCSADGFGSDAAPLAALTLSYVENRDVKALQRLLRDGGAQNVIDGEARYGKAVSASIGVDALVRLTPTIAPFVKPSGHIELEGIRADQCAGVTKALSPFYENVKVKATDPSGSTSKITGWRMDPWMVPGFSSVDMQKDDPNFKEIEKHREDLRKSKLSQFQKQEE